MFFIPPGGIFCPQLFCNQRIDFKIVDDFRRIYGPERPKTRPRTAIDRAFTGGSWEEKHRRLRAKKSDASREAPSAE